MRKRRSEHHDPLSCTTFPVRATNPNTGGTATYDRGSGAPMPEITEAERGQQVLWGRNIGHFLPHKTWRLQTAEAESTEAERGQKVLWGRNIGHFLPHKTSGLRTSEAGLRKDDEGAEKSDGEASRGQEFEEPWMKDDVAVTKVAVPFTKWVRMHVRRLLSTRTSFSYFLLKSISNCRGRSSTASTALFPIPVPFDDIWGRPMKRMNRRRREEVARRQLVHLAVMALNFMHSTAPLSCLDLLWRRPSSLHLGVYRRLGALIKACDHVETISISGVGRKHAKLGARMREVLDTLQSWGQGLRTGYDAGLEGMKVPMVNDEEELNPYRELNASRLKLTGTGGWNCLPYLDELLVLPFMEPEVLRHDGRPPVGSFPDVLREDFEEVHRLALRWDQNKLLRLIPAEDAPVELFRYVRPFNNYKNETSDRMIIDRRGQNFAEAVLHGPSSDLPSGVALLQLAPIRWDEVIVGCITDRRDYYHQIGVSPMRAATNCLYPPSRLSSFAGTHAHETFVQEFMKKPVKGSAGRHLVGDRLGGEKKKALLKGDPEVVSCFASIGQGDHLGVEIATSCHAGLLASRGLLDEKSRLLARSAILEDRCNEGLVIDDYFALSREDRLSVDFGKETFPRGASLAFKCFEKAKEIYKEEGIIGSDDKDQIEGFLFKAAGAEIDSRPQTVDDGAVLVASPAAKRLGLASITAVAAGMSFTSDSFHSSLVGSWVSVMMFRRSSMAIFDKVFGVVDSLTADPEDPEIKVLSRAAAEELAVASCLAPILSSNVAVPFSTKIFATDASNSKGAYVSAEVEEELSKLLWRSADKKGQNLPLLTPSQSVRREGKDHDLSREENEDEQKVPRPLGLWYEFVEVCGGAGKVTAELHRRGVVCGPIFDLAKSPAFDVADAKVLRWIAHLCEEGRLLSFLVAPPCTSFSPAAYPPVRTYAEPRGLLPLSEKAWIGNVLAFAAMFLLAVGLRLNVFGAGEQPRRSKMRWLKEWERLIALGAKETWLASCAYGSPHKKEFVLLSVNMNLSALHRKCPGNHKHVVIQGVHTKPSATYTDALAAAIATVFHDHLLAREKVLQAKEIEVGGLEDQLTNDLCAAVQWREEASWSWKGRSHINLLETAAVLKLYRDQARQGGDVRFVYLEDSHVSRSALARGRTSSHAMRPLLKKAAAIAIGYGLYPAGRFAPTRINPADAPTRNRPLEEPVPNSLCGGLGLSALHWLSQKPKLRRWASNWVRLVILTIPDHFRCRWQEGWRRHRAAWIVPEEVIGPNSQFDSTLGFPGEGPPRFALLGLPHLTLSFSVWIFVLCPLSCQGARGVPSGPFAVSHGDVARQRLRSGIELGAGRRVTESTASARVVLVENFKLWLNEQGIDFKIFLVQPPDLDRINAVLTQFGRFLFGAGKPYYHFSELINGIVTIRPTLRRSLQQAWDLAFLWGSYEPSEHHIAVPHQVLLSVLSVCLIWGWTREAGIFALAFGALLRIGEIVNADRADLILPSDVDFSISYMLLKIREPKTRFRAARHQAGKCESPDLIQVAILGLGRLKRHEKLWPHSSSTLRNRLSKVLKTLHLPSEPTDVPKAISLASFRPGGATWLITVTESAELVQRRGRWASWATMNIYLQEVAASTYLNDVEPIAKQAVLSGMAIFGDVLQQAITYKNSQVPETVWNFLFRANSKTCKDNVKVGQTGSFEW